MRSLLLLFLLSAILCNVFGQLKEPGSLKELRCEEFTPATPLTPVFVDYPKDGCVYIYATITGLDFESTNETIDAVIPEQGIKYMLMVKPEKQIITIKGSGYIEYPLKIESISAKEVRYYKLESIDDGGMIPVTLTVQPSGAQVYLNDQRVEDISKLTLAAGTYPIKIELAGYETIIRYIEVSRKDHNYAFTMHQPQKIKITVNSIPSAVNVLINNEPKGETPLLLNLLPGQYTLRASKPGYGNYSQQLDVSDGKDKTITINLDQTECRYHLEISPYDANVEINGAEYTDRNFTLAPGQYKITVSKNGYKTYYGVLDVGKDMPDIKKIVLDKITGHLRVTVSPDAAVVKLYKDGVYVEQWIGSMTMRDIQTGAYTLEVSASGYDSRTQSVSVTDGKTTTANISLTSTYVPPSYSYSSGVSWGWLDDLSDFVLGDSWRVRDKINGAGMLAGLYKNDFINGNTKTNKLIGLGFYGVKNPMHYALHFSYKSTSAEELPTLTEKDSITMYMFAFEAALSFCPMFKGYLTPSLGLGYRYAYYEISGQSWTGSMHLSSFYAVANVRLFLIGNLSVNYDYCIPLTSDVKRKYTEQRINLGLQFQ